MLRKATAFSFGGLLTTAETERWILWAIIIIITLLLSLLLLSIFKLCMGAKLTN